ncbi:MAG: cytochrome C [Betaproteobacteria bacterium]|nr:cytochrome C [Betaproteobacteria bacterium]
MFRLLTPRLAGLLAASLTAWLALFAAPAQAIPLFARQTGMQCSACHVGFPELNTFGRQFKLMGYTLGTRQTIPLAVMAIAGTNRISDNTTGIAPLPKNGDFALQAASLFTGGKITDHAGAFVQWTYNNLAGPDANNNYYGHSGIDNTDIRYTQRWSSKEQDLIWGLTLHNAPGVQDVWNSVPAWMFPYMSPALAVNANPSGAGDDPTFLDSQPRVTGLGTYAFLNNNWYGELTLYRSSDGVFSVLRAGDTPNPITDRVALKGYNPYWRLAYNLDAGPHSFMVGYYGINAKQYADYTQTDQPTTRYLDNAINMQYQYVGSPHIFTANLNWIHEKRNYDYDFNNTVGAASGHDNPTGTVNTFRAKGSYWYEHRYGATVGYFNNTTSTDALAYGASSYTNKGDSSGMMYELSYVPIQNIHIGLQYIAYNKRFGGSSYLSTDANGNTVDRKASADNTTYLYVWAAF